MAIHRRAEPYRGGVRISGRPPGEGQTLDVIFQAPRFDEAGKKAAGAVLDTQNAIVSALKAENGRDFSAEEIAEKLRCLIEALP